MSIKEKFDEIAKDYDKQRKELIPCFDDFYGLPIDMISFEGENPKILDIGAGTGLFSSMVLEKYPDAELTSIDLSCEMLNIAKKRFKDYSKVTYIENDYTIHEFNEKFDIVISALSIHHLNKEDKEKIYQKIYNILKNKGIFINADQFLSPSPNIERIYTDLMREFLENSGLNRENVKKAYERMNYDNPSTINDQIQWLVDCGFEDVDCIYKYYHFGVLYAKK